jgi:hypothetical protein
MYAQVAPVMRYIPRQRRPPLLPQIQNSLDRLRPDALAAEFYFDLLAAQLRKNDELDVDAQGSKAVFASFKGSHYLLTIFRNSPKDTHRRPTEKPPDAGARFPRFDIIEVMSREPEGVCC